MLLPFAREKFNLIIKQLVDFERKVPRKIFGPYYDTQQQSYMIRPSIDLYTRYDDIRLSRLINKRRLQWAGHVWRATGSLPHLALTSQIEAKRPRGRPKTRWLDCITKSLQAINPELSLDMAHERDRWKDLLLLV